MSSVLISFKLISNVAPSPSLSISLPRPDCHKATYFDVKVFDKFWDDDIHTTGKSIFREKLFVGRK